MRSKINKSMFNTDCTGTIRVLNRICPEPIATTNKHKFNAVIEGLKYIGINELSEQQIELINCYLDIDHILSIQDIINLVRDSIYNRDKKQPE